VVSSVTVLEAHKLKSAKINVHDKTVIKNTKKETIETKDNFT